MTHTELCEKIAAHLKALAGLAAPERSGGGCWYVRPNNFGFGRKGIPDFIVCRAGRMYALEVKVGRDKPSPWQAREMAGIAAAGGHPAVIRNFPDDMPEGLR